MRNIIFTKETTELSHFKPESHCPSIIEIILPTARLIFGLRMDDQQRLNSSHKYYPQLDTFHSN